MRDFKSVRRRLLQVLYARYVERPLEMTSPREFEESSDFTPDELAFNMHYLHDSGLVELMMGYHPRLFNAARITAKGIDLVENRFEFDRRFPPEPSDNENALYRIPLLLEELLEEAELCGLGREQRMGLLRDIHFLRDEMARPVEACRYPVVRRVLEWISEPFEGREEELPSLKEIRSIIRTECRESPEYPPPHSG